MTGLHWNGKVYPVLIERKRVKNINMRVRQDGTIYVSAPPSVPEERIQALLHRNAERFAAACDRLREANVPDYADGAQVQYLGETLRLCWSERPCRTKREGTALTVFARTPEEAAYAYRMWCIEECKVLCTKLNAEVYNAFRAAGYHVPAAHIEIKEMNSRWGSCTAKTGRISINFRLMQYPEGCMRGVFFHEYTHFLHQDHGAGFYAELRRMCPDYDKWDRILKGRDNT